MVLTSSESTPPIVLTWNPLPTTKLLTSAFLSSSLATKDHNSSSSSSSLQIHELNATPESELASILSTDGMLICAGSLAQVSHLLAPNQKKFFDATEDSYLFRSLISPSFPEYTCFKSTEPWSVPLDWTHNKRYVVKPNIGYSSIDTFIVNNASEQAKLKTPLSPPNREFIIEEFIIGEFFGSDIVVDGDSVLVTSVYRRFDYDIKETVQYHASKLYREHAQVSVGEERP